jgi:tRNA dimethylallyltransferase
MTDEATRTFFIIGPTATGKSELAADVARNLGAEIVSADAFQIYRGLDLLTAKPDASTLAKAPHHLIGTMSILQEMNAEKFRRAALVAIHEINSRNKLAIVTGGSGLYIKALTHGLSAAPAVDPKLRAELDRLSFDDLRKRLVDLDPEIAGKIEMKNRRRVSRALEICLSTMRPPLNPLPQGEEDATRQARVLPSLAEGLFVFRAREELHTRIDQRVEAMFEKGVIEEVRDIGAMSVTASKTIGLREIRNLIDGKMSILPCIATIQQATRQYAKRQLTWFRHQTNFEPLNISLLTHKEAVEGISQRALLAAKG